MQSFFSQYNLSEEIVAVGVSGGADSLALVLRLKKFMSILGCAADFSRLMTAVYLFSVKKERKRRLQEKGSDFIIKEKATGGTAHEMGHGCTDENR